MAGYENKGSNTIDVLDSGSEATQVLAATPKEYIRKVGSLASYGISESAYKAVFQLEIRGAAGTVASQKTTVELSVDSGSGYVFVNKQDFAGEGFHEWIAGNCGPDDLLKFKVSYESDEANAARNSVLFNFRVPIVLGKAANCAC